MPQAPPVTIAQALDEFLDAQRARLSDTTYRRYEDVIALLHDCLNGYGYQSLSKTESRRWQAAFDAGDEQAFCQLFGPEKITDELGNFLDWFMVRKVMAGDDFLRTAGTVTKKLARWLHEHGHIDAGAADEAVERGGEASRDLPAASRLTDALTDLCARAPAIDPNAVADEDWIEDSMTITRIEPGRVWLGDIGPLTLPKRATAGAQPGWEVWIAAARIDGRWHLLENGFVYP